MNTDSTGKVTEAAKTATGTKRLMAAGTRAGVRNDNMAGFRFSNKTTGSG